MKHIAIDLGGRESQICVRSEDGKIEQQGKQPTAGLERLFIREAKQKARVIVETSAEAFAVADAAMRHGHEVRVVPSTLAKSLGVGARRMKTDERDARTLSEVSCRIDLPSVHIPSQQTRERRSLCTLREGLVSSRTQLINSVRGYLRTLLVKAPTATSQTFPKRVREKLLERPEGIAEMVERVLVVIEAQNAQIKAADAELKRITEEDATCRRLMTVPGVGPVTALRYSAALEKVDRFENSHKVESYLGLTPGENSSSERQRRTGITKAGPPQVRRVLIQASWCLWRTRPEDRNVLWAKEVAKRRGNWVAIVALSRKLAGILFAMWRDGKDYDTNHGQPVAP